MTKREEEQLNRLLAKKEAEEKADKEFFLQVGKRKKDVIKYLGLDKKQEKTMSEDTFRFLYKRWYDEDNREIGYKDILEGIVAYFREDNIHSSIYLKNLEKEAVEERKALDKIDEMEE